jgi:hypothetical protein
MSGGGALGEFVFEIGHVEIGRSVNGVLRLDEIPKGASNVARKMWVHEGNVLQQECGVNHPMINASRINAPMYIRLLYDSISPRKLPAPIILIRYYNVLMGANKECIMRYVH